MRAGYSSRLEDEGDQAPGLGGVLPVFRIAGGHQLFLDEYPHQGKDEHQRAATAGAPRPVGDHPGPGEQAYRGVDGVSNIPVWSDRYQPTLGRIGRQMETAQAEGHPCPEKKHNRHGLRHDDKWRMRKKVPPCQEPNDPRHHSQIREN
jgi:hypothetical protein